MAETLVVVNSRKFGIRTQYRSGATDNSAAISNDVW